MHIYNLLSAVLIRDTKTFEDTDKVYINILCIVDNLDIYRGLYTKSLRISETPYTRRDRNYAGFGVGYFYISFIRRYVYYEKYNWVKVI